MLCVLAECPVGTFSSDGYVPQGATECTNCPRGFYQPATGQSECEACPNNQLTDLEGTVNASECRNATGTSHFSVQEWVLYLFINAGTKKISIPTISNNRHPPDCS